MYADVRRIHLDNDNSEEKIMLKDQWWYGVRDKIDFKVVLYYGGGLGDLAHRLYDSLYIRRLRSIKKVFPKLQVIQLLDTTRSMGSAKALFELNPYIDLLHIGKQDFMNRDIYVFAANLLSKRKHEINKFIPEEDAEWVFLRIVNRVYELLAFPRTKSITIDDFFQQFKLDINDFELDDPKIFLSKEEEDYGKKIKTDLIGNSKHKMVGIHFFTGDGKRMLNPHFGRSIINDLIEKNYRVVILGTEKESNSENFKDKTSLRDMALFMNRFKDNKVVSYQCNDTPIRHKIAIIKNCDYFICNDSGLQHLAWINKTKTISILREQTVMERDRFGRKTGYYWAFALNKPFATYVIMGDRSEFDTRLLYKRMAEMDAIEE